MMTRVVIAICLIALSGSVCEAKKHKKHGGYGYGYGYSYPVAAPVVAAPACRSVPYTEQVQSVRTEYVPEQYDCSFNQTTEVCNDVVETVEKTCHSTELVSEDYDCSYTTTSEVCDTGYSKGGAHRYLKGKHKKTYVPVSKSWVAPVAPPCRQVENLVQKTCQRSREVSRPYSCPQQVSRRQCHPVSTLVPKTCTKSVAVEVPVVSSVTRYRRVCATPAPVQRTYVPVAAAPMYSYGHKKHGHKYKKH